jgi:glyoxylase I family protein
VVVSEDRQASGGGIIIEKSTAKAKKPEMYVLQHGYCRSLYVNDPNGMIIKFTNDNPHASEVSEHKRRDARRELRRWLNGDHTSNNTFR